MNPGPCSRGDDYYWRLRTVDTEGARSPASTILHSRSLTTGAHRPRNRLLASGGIAITDDTPTYRWNHATDPTSTIRSIRLSQGQADR